MLKYYVDFIYFFKFSLQVFNLLIFNFLGFLLDVGSMKTLLLTELLLQLLDSLFCQLVQLSKLTISIKWVNRTSCMNLIP